VIFRQEDDSTLKITTDEIPALLAPFTGLKPEENSNLLPLTDGIVYLAGGWDGQIAIVSDPAREKWLKGIWEFATDYAAVLHDLDRYLYVRTLALRKESNYSKSIQAQTEMDSIQRIELSIDVITHEILPHNFGGIKEEIQVYLGIYDSWQMERIAESLKNKFTFLNAMFRNINTAVTNSMQARMNLTMLVFTILTFAGVIASVISTTDFSGIFLSSKLRLFVIIFGTISFGLLSVAYLIINQRRP